MNDTSGQTLSILIPVYNEEFTIDDLLDQVLAAPLPPGLKREIIVVDDCSRDGTRERLRARAAACPDMRLILHAENQGKGAAIRAAIAQSTGDYCLIQDADLEYDPREYPRLLAPLRAGDADVVYGSRFLRGECVRVLYFWHSVGNRLLTLLSNMFTNLNLTDMETCYKVARGDLLRSIPIRCNRFGLEPELTAKFAKRGCRIYEVPISYRGRTYQEGKKITWRDGFKALFLIVWFALVDDAYTEAYGRHVAQHFAGTHRFHRWLAALLGPHVGRRALEVGAGIGRLTMRLLPREAYVAAESDPQYLHYLRNVYAGQRRIRVARLDPADPASFAELGAERFDTILCVNRLERLDDDAAAVRALAERLTPGGRLCVVAARGPRLFGALDRAMGYRRRYTPAALRGLLAAAGLEPVAARSFNRLAVPGWWLNSVVLRRKNFGLLQLKLFDALVGVWRRLDPLVPWPGLSQLVVGQKPEAV